MRCWQPFFSLVLPRAQLTLSHQPLLPIQRAFDSILRGISLERKQTNNRIAASTGAIDPRIGEEFHRLPYAEFMF